MFYRDARYHALGQFYQPGTKSPSRDDIDRDRREAVLNLKQMPLGNDPLTTSFRLRTTTEISRSENGNPPLNLGTGSIAGIRRTRNRRTQLLPRVGHSSVPVLVDGTNSDKLYRNGSALLSIKALTDVARNDITTVFLQNSIVMGAAHSALMSGDVRIMEKTIRCLLYTSDAADD